MAEYIEKQDIKNIIERERQTGNIKKLVLATGLFDVMTVFDIRYLRGAKNLGDILFVAVYSDDMIKKKFGEKRLTTPFKDRIEILKGMEMVDYIVRRDDNIDNILAAVKPDFIIEERVVDYDIMDAILAKHKK